MDITSAKRVIESRYSGNMRPQRGRHTVTDFELVKTIGKGAFGVVHVARELKTKRVIALKIMSKTALCESGTAATVHTELQVLARVAAANDSSRFLSSPTHMFSDNDLLCIGMNYMRGGDLMGLLIKRDIFSVEETRFYMAQLICAVAELHALGFMHRDIKPDNIFLDSRGCIKLGDFGLCKQIQSTLRLSTQSDGSTRMSGADGKTFTIVGTLDYMAPETIRSIGYDNSVDLWAVGVIAYECLVGHAPFFAESQHDTAQKIATFVSPISFSCDDIQCRSFVNNLICDANIRMNADAAKAHAFLTNVDWSFSRPPFIPSRAEDTDTSNFDEFELVPPIVRKNADPLVASIFKATPFAISSSLDDLTIVA